MPDTVIQPKAGSPSCMLGMQPAAVPYFQTDMNIADCAVLAAASVASVGRRRGSSRSVQVAWDDGAVWKVPEKIIDEKRISPGDSYDERRREALWREVSREGAVMSALRLVSMRDHLEGELRRKLRERGFPEDAVSYAIVQCRNRDLLNDEAKAAHLAESRLAKPGKGERIVSAELVSKGIRPEAAKSIVGRLTDDNEQANSALRWLSSGGKRYLKAGSDAKANMEVSRKLAAALFRRGYSPSVIRRVLVLARDMTENDDSTKQAGADDE